MSGPLLLFRIYRTIYHTLFTTIKRNYFLTHVTYFRRLLESKNTLYIYQILFSCVSLKFVKIFGTHRVFWRVAVTQHPSATVEGAHHRERGMLRLSSRRQWGGWDWCNPSTCRYYISRSDSASCCNRCAVCSRSCRCSDPPATETGMKQKILI